MASGGQIEEKEERGGEKYKERRPSAEHADKMMNPLVQDAKPRAKQNGEPNECEEGPLMSDGAPLKQRTGKLRESSKDENESAGTPVEKPPEEPARRNFQIPRKNREKKALFQPLSLGSREFEEILKILNSSYLEPSSASSFIYRKASLIHSELLEKEFFEKRRELKYEGRTEKELAESYAFLLVDRSQVQNICEKGLHVGNSRVAILGNPSMGVCLSKYSDLLQANPLDSGATGDIIIFKVIKGRVKSIYDNIAKNAFDPTPKHECHIAKSAARVTSLLAYRAFELTQYYFYEYGFDEIRRRPRHVYPYAVVSFAFKDKEVTQLAKPFPPSRSNSSSSDRSTDSASFTLWRGQLLNKGKLICYASLKSASRPFLPFKLPEKLTVDIVMNIDHLKKRVPGVLFYKETYMGAKEVLKNGLYCSLYELVEKMKIGSYLEGLLLKLEKEKLVLVKPLGDKGFLFLLSPLQMASPYEPQTGRSRFLQALFLFQEPRGVVRSTKSRSSLTPSAQDTHEVMPQLMKFVPALHFAVIQSRRDTSSSYSSVVEKHVNEYLKRRSGKRREFILYPYDSRLDDKRFLYSSPKNKNNVDVSLRTYIFGSDTYQLPVWKAKELLENAQKPEQFSPVSDYDSPEDECDAAKSGKQNGPKTEPVASVQQKSSADYDPDRLKELINLIQSRKKNVSVGEESDPDDSRKSHGLKRKLEASSENLRKYLKSDSATNRIPYEGDTASESPHSVSSLINELGGQDTDLRQQDFADSTPTNTGNLIKLLLEALTGSGQLDSLRNSVNQELGVTSNKTNEDTRELPTQEPEVVQSKEEYGLHDAPPDHDIVYDNPQSPVLFEASGSCVTHPIDVDLRLTAGEIATDKTLDSKVVRNNKREILEDVGTGSVSSFDGYSPSPSTPIEHVNRKDQIILDPLGKNEVNWKLIPITGMKSPEEQLLYLPPEDALPNDPRVIQRRRNSDYYQSSNSPYFEPIKEEMDDTVLEQMEENLLEQIEVLQNPVTLQLDCHKLTAEYPQTGIIENTVFKEYGEFCSKIQAILEQKNVLHDIKMTAPVFSFQERLTGLSKYVNSHTSHIAVQQHVENLREKMNNLISSVLPVSSFQEDPLGGSLPADGISSLPVGPDICALYACASEDLSTLQVTGQSQTDSVNSLSTDCRTSNTNHASNSQERVVLPNQTVYKTDQEITKKTQELMDPLNISTTQPCLSNLISQLQPEVFTSLVKIIKDVQKNIVKFYIHEDGESTVCTEIKEYLTKLGNTECPPQLFLEKRNTIDKLLIIIQNEDIACLLHKIPTLVTLKKLSCVSFAGVDSLDDVKNHTYNELFVSGGFIVSDESVLNPDSITFEKLQYFLSFLEKLNTPESKWQWKIHCKIQKKLKELGRRNAKALNMLTLLNSYQKKNMVEILSYHECDSQTRNAAELDCLIRLQAQNIQQRHVVFLTERNVETFLSYSDNGIVVATIEDFQQNFTRLIGYHSSAAEDKCQLGADSQESHSEEDNILESAKTEEDMSLDSADETSQIEVCATTSNYECHTNILEAKSQELARIQPKESLLTLKPKNQLPLVKQCISKEKASETDSEDEQSSTDASTIHSDKEDQSSLAQQKQSAYSHLGYYQSMSQQYSHFSVLTHQTFLGTGVGSPYSASLNQNQDCNNYLPSGYGQTSDGSSTTNWDEHWNANSNSPSSYMKRYN
ncbi:protein TASOR isoform X2 [Latimeria chalumnae]|uniref:protein TASOR isoform X2 n=1 Tax=Latimeria chalumnae TaxID=7897 RepID=UPI0006D920AB|nr:PREDICTED: protein TASOR isoform X2 [Latimeria chalumnae]|eukprot:XP_014349850.1 PREDICTED: protein TASOR isoform X2 [Latimeria chalumnae]